MLDTHSIARKLTEAGLAPAHADAITDAVREAAEHQDADLVTRNDLTSLDLVSNAGLAAMDLVSRSELKAELATLEVRLYRFLLVQSVGIVGLTVAFIRLMG